MTNWGWGISLQLSFLILDVVALLFSRLREEGLEYEASLGYMEGFLKKEKGGGDMVIVFSLPEKRITQGGETTAKSLDDTLPSTSEASLYSLKNRRQKLKI